MSGPGVQSNRGDGYQTLVAFEWALKILSDPQYLWLEIDSVSFAVDDVVIGKSDGSTICCQCKKNQSEFKAWSFGDLKEELCKVTKLLSNNSSALVRFYSRSNFGDLAKLKEKSANSANEFEFQNSLGKAHLNTNNQLAALIADQSSLLSNYQVLQRINFETSSNLDLMQERVKDQLRILVSHHQAAFDALWTRLDFLGMRENSDSQKSVIQHRLTKADLKEVLIKSGSILTPPMDVTEAKASFIQTSAIGRSWRRDIGTKCIPRNDVNDLMEAIKAKPHSILLTGPPGSGKTCVLLDVQEKLELLKKNGSNLLPLFIQSREFVDLINDQDRQAHGLPDNWVETAARLAEDTHVIVIIDSLDVLAIAREHTVFNYFLAQIDRLLSVPNITVVTACRDFDRQYDRRIAQRTWNQTIICQPLDWTSEILPLLTQLDIDASNIDKTTQELVRNPRELALFVELALQGGSFNVVTSQMLAQRYLTVIVEQNSSLGVVALQSIEAMAEEMLKTRSLSISPQRFNASAEIMRALLSNQVLHETNDSQLTFGHQTLLDVLVISGAIREGVSLNEFIQRLPPVPFVRPSIRSFVKELSSGDRKKYRGQLRTVLTSNTAFHIRRLVAETYAELAPHDDDWPLIRDVRMGHMELFRVIYLAGNQVEWHQFWMKFLVPNMKEERDFLGLESHVNRVTEWQNDDPVGIINFWSEMLKLDEVDKVRIAGSIAYSIKKIHEDHLSLCHSLLVDLLKLPRQQYGSIGRALVRCVSAGQMSDAFLWTYMVGDIDDEDVLKYRFGKKLHTSPHDLGVNDNSFLTERMQKSTELLKLAVDSIEQWSQVKGSRYGLERTTLGNTFLNYSSYEDTHSQRDLRHRDSERYLFDAVESAIVHHAVEQTPWWQANQERLCFSLEVVLRYVGLLACLKASKNCLDLSGRMLSDKMLIESVLSFEVGTLLTISFLHFNSFIQDKIQASILCMHAEHFNEPKEREWIYAAQTQLILAIPCHLRNPELLAVLNESEKHIWPQTRQPHIGSRGGFVRDPFSYKVFLNASDEGVLRLLNHYVDHRRNSSVEFLIGGEQQVGGQLCEASSRDPSRFINILLANWEQLTERFRDDLMEGISNYLAYQYGDLQAPNSWVPINEPVQFILIEKVINELETHPIHWHHNRVAAKALESCAFVAIQKEIAIRIITLVALFSSLDEESSLTGENVNLLESGLNMTRGRAAETLMILANQFHQKSIAWPETLPDALRLYASDDHPSVRAMMLHRLPYMQSYNSALGWDLFSLVMNKNTTGLWEIAEPCLYYSYEKDIDLVRPYLKLIIESGEGKDFETWGRISALSALSGLIEFSEFLSKLSFINSGEAWNGAASVWSHHGNIQQHKTMCLQGIEAGLDSTNKHALKVTMQFETIFNENNPPTEVPVNLIKKYFSALSTNPEIGTSEIYGFNSWLNATSLRDPILAMETAETYVKFIQVSSSELYDYEDNYPQLLTRLFAQAEEMEESDNGYMLTKVVSLQDSFLAMGVNNLDHWLEAAERP